MFEENINPRHMLSENVNIRSLKYLGYRFSKREDPFSGVCPFHFYAICTRHELASFCVIIKKTWEVK
jgi:hypothetical protein